MHVLNTVAFTLSRVVWHLHALYCTVHSTATVCVWVHTPTPTHTSPGNDTQPYMHVPGLLLPLHADHFPWAPTTPLPCLVSATTTSRTLALSHYHCDKGQNGAPLLISVSFHELLL